MRNGPGRLVGAAITLVALVAAACGNGGGGGKERAGATTTAAESEKVFGIIEVSDQADGSAEYLNRRGYDPRVLAIPGIESAPGTVRQHGRHGVAHDLVVRSMRLLGEEVAPLFC